MKAVWSTVCILVAIFAGSASAYADGWALPNLNPFAKKDGATPAPTTTKPTSDAAKGMSGPTVPQLGKKTAAQPAPQPSIFNKIGSGTANVMNKTKQMFAPQKSAPSPVALGSQASKPKKADSAPGWNPFAPKKPEPEPARTASEFIGQPRPRL